MEALGLTERKGRWQPEDPDNPSAAVIEVVEALHDTLLRYRSTRSDNHIILLGGCGNDAPEIHCALKQSHIFQRPFAATEQEAKNKLLAWLEKQQLEQHDRRSGTQAPTSPDDTTVVSSIAPEPPFAATEADAVRALRQRGYHIFHGSITPPPAYNEHASSQPIRGNIGEITTVSASRTNKRKRDETGLATRSCPSTPDRGRYTVAPALAHAVGRSPRREIQDSEGEDEDKDENENEDATNGHLDEHGADDANDAIDEMCETPTQRRKRQKTTTTETAPAASAPQPKKQGAAKTTPARALQRPTTPPRCRKTKQSTLTSVFSREEVAGRTGIPVEDVGGLRRRAAEVNSDAHKDAATGCNGDEDEIVMTEDGMPVHEEQEDNGAPQPYDAPSPEEECASNLLALQASQPSTPPAAAAAADGSEESFFVPEQSPPTPQQLERSTDARSSQDNSVSLQWSAEERRLHRSFDKDIETARASWYDYRTEDSMKALEAEDPGLDETFNTCLRIARKVVDEEVIDTWRMLLEQGWEERDRSTFVATPLNPTRQEIATAAYREFQIIETTVTNRWRADFEYRRAAAELYKQCNAYAKLRNSQSSPESHVSPREETDALKALFRDMNATWRDALPGGFTNKQARSSNLLARWNRFKLAKRDGQRWHVFIQELGLGALLLINASGDIDTLRNKTNFAVFVAWVRLLPRVTPELQSLGERMLGYYDELEDPACLVRVLRGLKLERRAYHAAPLLEQFDYSGSEGRRTPTVNPGYLMQANAMYNVDQAAIDELSSVYPLDD